MKKLIICVVLLAGCGTLHEDYVQQDRNNYETLWPCVEKMLETSEYDDAKKKDIRDRGAAWDLWTFEGLEAVKKDSKE